METYAPTSFIPPKLLQFAAAILSFNSQSILVMLSDDRSSHAKYIKGMFGLATFYFIVWLLWSFLILGCRHQNAGCLSGQAFPRSSLPTVYSSSEAGNQDVIGEEGSTDEALHVKSNQSTDSFNDSEYRLDENSVITDGTLDLKIHAGHVDMACDVPDPVCYVRCCCPSDAQAVRRRKIGTRIVFVFFGSLVIACTILFITGGYFPMIDATETFSQLLGEGFLIVHRIQWALKVVRKTSAATNHIHQTLVSSLDRLCPNIPVDMLGSVLGVDPRTATLYVERGYSYFLDSVEDKLPLIDSGTNEIDQIIGQVDHRIQQTQENLWVVPVVILCVAIITIVWLLQIFWIMMQEYSQFTYDELAQIRQEQILVWLILPFFVLLTFLLWIIAIGVSIGAIAVTDICLPSPDTSIQIVLQTRNVGMESFLGKSITSYTRGCYDGDDPIETLRNIEVNLEGALQIIENYMIEVNRIGYDTLKQICGPDNTVDTFFNGMSELSFEMTSAHAVLLDTVAALECPQVYDLFSRMVHNTGCTDFSLAIVTEFLCILALSVCSMFLITLRSSWRYAG